MNQLISILKKIAIFPIILVALTTLGAAINAVVPWDYLTIFFGIIRRFVLVFDFTWDTITMLLLVGLAFSVEVSYWAFRALLLIAHLFIKK